jgi:hypothetical protein
MLQFSESLVRELRNLRKETESIVIGGRVKSMENYERLMGRLEGYQFVEDALKGLLEKNLED